MFHQNRLMLLTLGVLAHLLLAALMLGGCSPASSTEAATPQTAHSDERHDWPPVIRIGFVPSEGGVDIVERFSPLIDHLRTQLNHPIEARSATEYIGVITAMQNRQLEFAYFGPKSYVEANIMAGAEAIVRELDVNGNPGYRGLIVVHRDSPFQSLSELQDTKFGLVATNSTSGYLVPAVGIREATGKMPDAFFGNIVWTGTHGNAIHAVIQRQLDGAATNDLDLQAMHNAGLVDQTMLRTVWTSDLIPSSPIAARRDIPESLKTALRDAVLSMNDLPETLASMSRGGYLPATDSEYDSIRVLQSVEQNQNSGG